MARKKVNEEASVEKEPEVKVSEEATAEEEVSRLDVFEFELGLIQNEKIKEYAIAAINILPEYFFHIPASSTGKYHPKYALGEGGLVRHVKACARFADECFRLDWYNVLTRDEKDLVIVSMLLHDGWKSGTSDKKSQYTADDHPLIAARELRDSQELKGIISEEYEKIIQENILTHMGQWRFFRNTNEAFAPKPATNSQKLVHFVDYVCSRKMFEVEF